MRATKKLLYVGLPMALAAIIGQVPAAAQAPAGGQAGTPVHCSWKAMVQGSHFSVDGTRAGPVTCSGPLGTGRYRARYHDQLDPPTASETASSRLSFQAGTVHGHSRVSGPFQATTRYRGTLHISGGTEKFKQVRGTLQLNCTIRTTEETCHASGHLTGI